MMDEANQIDVAELLAEHSNTGTMDLMSSAHHFLITRLIYQKIWTDSLTESEFDQFAQEAWLTFLIPNLYSYHTWLIEVADEQTQEYMKSVLVEGLIDRVLAEWENLIADTKADWIAELTG